MTNSTVEPLGNTTSNKDHTKIEQVTVTCACNRDITLDELHEAFPERGKEILEKFLPKLNSTMTHYEITSCLRKAHFLAQVGHESSELFYTAENVSAEDEKKINGGYNGYEGKSTSRLRLLRNAVNSLHVVACPQLDALFTAFPEIAMFTYETFKLEKSKAYDKPDMAFAWGYWHDPKSKMHGTKKDVELAKLGYSRYAELYEGLTEAQIKKLSKKRFGILRKEMISHAKKGLYIILCKRTIGRKLSPCPEPQ